MIPVRSIVAKLIFISTMFGALQAFANEGIVSVPGADLYFKSIGKGEPIVILHGGPGLDHSYLLPQFEQLAKTNTVIFYDQRGSGRSTGTIDSLSIRPSVFVDDLEALRKYLHLKKMNILGHSWGGLLGIEYARRFPKNVRSLILLSTAGASSDYVATFNKNREIRRTPADAASIQRLMTTSDVAMGDSAAISELLRLFFKSYFHDQSLSSQLAMNLPQSTAKHLFSVLTLMNAHYAQYDYHTELNKIHFPVLVLHGDDDPIPYLFAKRIKDQIPDAQFILLKNCGHFPYIESPETLFTAVTTFLKKSTR